MTTSTTTIDYQSALELGIAADVIFEAEFSPNAVSIIDALTTSNPTITDMVPAALTLASRLALKVDQLAPGYSPARHLALDTLVDSIFTRIWNATPEDLPHLRDLMRSVVFAPEKPRRQRMVQLADPVEDLASVVRFVVTLSFMLSTLTPGQSPGAPIQVAAKH